MNGWLDSYGVPAEHFIYLLALFLVLAVLALPFRRIGLMRLLSYAAAWAAIFGGLWFVLDRSPTVQRYVAEASVARDEPQVDELSGEPGAEVRVRAALDGHFWVRAQLNGQSVRFLVDTGASDVVLSSSTAARVGIDTDVLRYDRLGVTASGRVQAAQARIDRFSIGPIVRNAMPISIIQGDVPINLLGMRFLRSLSGWRVEGDTLVLVS